MRYAKKKGKNLSYQISMVRLAEKNAPIDVRIVIIMIIMIIVIIMIIIILRWWLIGYSDSWEHFKAGLGAQRQAVCSTDNG